MSDENTGEKQDAAAPVEEALKNERYELLRRLEDSLETPMLVLAFVWLALLVGELIWGESLMFEVLGTIIWVIFILDFAVAFVLAPHKIAYLKNNWLTALSLLVPALRLFRFSRVFRLFRLARMGRSLRLLRVVSSLNRGMRALGASLSRRGFGYVLALTVLVAFTGAAGMYAFENAAPGGLKSYGEALWWTTMVLTTMGSQYWPQTIEGARALRLPGAVCVCRLRLRDGHARHLLHRPRRGGRRSRACRCQTTGRAARGDDRPARGNPANHGGEHRGGAA